MKNILSVKLEQVDKIFNPELLEIMTSLENNAGKNEERYWILNTNIIVNGNDVINNYFNQCKQRGFGAVQILKQ